MLLVHSTYFRNGGGEEKEREEIKRGKGGKRKIERGIREERVEWRKKM